MIPHQITLLMNKGDTNFKMVIVQSLEKHKLENESASEFINRICSLKSELNLTWKNVAQLLNEELHYTYDESWYRKQYQSGAFRADYCQVETAVSCDDCVEEDDYENRLSEKLLALNMKKVEVSDLVTQNNAYIRRLSREQTLKDIAHDYAQTMNSKKILEPCVYSGGELSSNEGVLLLSDWHYGMVCDNPWNKFDPDICKIRVNKLLNKVINIVKKEQIEHVHVLDLADLIAGRIHTQIRIESRFDVITQTMQVAEILAEFLNDLSYHCGVSFYSCLDNHSRLGPNKKESMDLESLARLSPWYLTERLKDNDCIQICDNEFGADIITCTVAGHKVIGVHGDNDQPRTALERLSLMTHQHYDMLCTAHLHHFSCDENHQTMIVSNSSLMGVDRYAEKLRLTSDPSQTFIVSSKENICECIYRIVLK